MVLIFIDQLRLVHSSIRWKRGFKQKTSVVNDLGLRHFEKFNEEAMHTDFGMTVKLKTVQFGKLIR